LKKNADYPHKQIIGKVIGEELQTTAWNLSSNFLLAKQTQARLYLTGVGDPTNGHGGYSYVKKPLKTSRYDKDDAAKAHQASSETPGKNAVAGTDADLRRLKKKELIEYAMTQGYEREHLAKLPRWDIVALLKQHQTGGNHDTKKFARPARITTKVQREKYQKEINRLFAKLMSNLSVQESSGVKSEDEKDEEPMEDTLDTLIARGEHHGSLNRVNTMPHHQ
jgi:transcription initiation factor TFIID subunit 1